MDASAHYASNFKRKFTGTRAYTGATNATTAEYVVPQDCYAMAFMINSTHFSGTPVVSLFCADDTSFLIASSTTQTFMVPGMIMLLPGQTLASSVNFQGVSGQFGINYCVFEFYLNQQ